jgi:hypothetical protein
LFYLGTYIQGRRHFVTAATSVQSCAYRSLCVTIKLDSDSFPHLFQKRRSQLGFVTYLLYYPRTTYVVLWGRSDRVQWGCWTGKSESPDRCQYREQVMGWKSNKSGGQSDVQTRSGRPTQPHIQWTPGLSPAERKVPVFITMIRTQRLFL